MAITDYYKTITKCTTTETLDATGGAVLSYVETTFQGLINPADSNLIDLADKLNVRCTHKLYCNVTEDFNYVDMIKYQNKNYKIMSDLKNTVQRDHHYKVMLERIDNNG